MPDDTINQHTVDRVSDYLAAEGWSFGWYQVENKNDGTWQWQADVVKGQWRFVARGRTLGETLEILQKKILSMN